MLEDDILIVFNFQQSLFFAHSNNHRYISGTQLSAVTWRTIDEHTVADAFCSKNAHKKTVKLKSLFKCLW